MKEESKKVGLQLNIQTTKIMAFSPITSWQIDGETMETVRYFIFLASKITADGDCSNEIQRHFLLGDGLDHCLLYNVTNLRPFFRHSIRSNVLLINQLFQMAVFFKFGAGTHPPFGLLYRASLSTGS